MLWIPRSILPNPGIRGSGYETLVADLEGESRRLIEFLGLDWEPRLPRIPQNRAAGGDGKWMAGAPASVYQLGGTLAEI